MSKPAQKIFKAYLVAGGRFHDIDYARLELLKHFAAHEDVRVRVGSDYHEIEEIETSDFLVTYTCDVTPPEDIQLRLKAWVGAGHKWFALHGTNSILRFLPDGRVDSPRIAPVLMDLLGSQFIAHPPIGPYTVKIADADHALTRGLSPFETSDELYLSEYHGTRHSLLYCENTGDAKGFVEEAWTKGERHEVMYLHPVGAGEVLYLTLGHCRGHFDMRPMLDRYPVIERGSWELPQFHELLRRGLAWAKG
jgi:uncharacterized protein